MIDGYTRKATLACGDSVPLGIQLILVCRVVGLPYGTPLNYTWTCPNGPCEVEGYYGRKVYNEHILAVNTTSTSDGGRYTCRLTATGGQEATGNFTLRVPGMVHSYIYTVCPSRDEVCDYTNTIHNSHINIIIMPLCPMAIDIEILARYASST